MCLFFQDWFQNRSGSDEFPSLELQHWWATWWALTCFVRSCCGVQSRLIFVHPLHIHLIRLTCQNPSNMLTCKLLSQCLHLKIQTSNTNITLQTGISQPRVRLATKYVIKSFWQSKRWVCPNEMMIDGEKIQLRHDRYASLIADWENSVIYNYNYKRYSLNWPKSEPGSSW